MRYFVVMLLAVFSFSVTAEEATAEAKTVETPKVVEEVATEVTQSVEEKVTTNEVPKTVMTALKRIFNPTVKIDTSNIKKSAVSGLYEIVVGVEVFYISEDGEHFIVGDVRSTNTRENLTENRRAELRLAAIEKIDDKDAIEFAPADKKYTVNVFTDVDCPYCSKIHNEVKKLNAKGVSVRYLAFPRSAVGSKTWNRMVSVWCADDRHQAMTDAKANKTIEEKLDCENPLEQQKTLGMHIGVTGTPALILPNGELVPGYMPAERLLGLIEEGML